MHLENKKIFISLCSSSICTAVITLDGRDALLVVAPSLPLLARKIKNFFFFFFRATIAERDGVVLVPFAAGQSV
jgi:hypothetical protein